MTLSHQDVRIVGAGMAGALLAVMLARRGLGVSLFDRRPDPRYSPPERGRSINLALAARGIRALEHAGVMRHVRPLLIEMRGRRVHVGTEESKLLPYGWKPGEVIYSVGRDALTRVLIEAAGRYPNVTMNFGERCLGASARHSTLRFCDDEPDEGYELQLSHTIATDGAGSIIRSSLAAEGMLTSREEMLDHDYKELTLPAVNGKPALDTNALHVWPRGGFMLIALPNTDASFTATLFLSRRQFAELTTPDAVLAFFQREFPDAVPLIPNLLTEFFEHPQGQLGTVHVSPWHVGSKVLLMGDAAHAIVPFHGQGMNAAFEDCLAFDALIARSGDWQHLFAEFDRVRRPNTEAIATMALENYIEMRDTVLDPQFQRFKVMSVELEKRFPDRFIPRYSMVMFHPEISYADALQRGQIQLEILAELDSGDPAVIDFERARTLIDARLKPI